MDEGNTPPGVDPALWREFKELSDHVHELHRRRNDEEQPDPPTRRMVVDVPQEWFLLFAWIEKRQRAWLQGDNGPTGLTPERIELFGRMTRPAVSRYLQHTLDGSFHNELHWLATGASELLRPRPPKPEPTAVRRSDSDDEIPF